MIDRSKKPLSPPILVIGSASIYFLLMLIAVGYFEYQVRLLKSDELHALFAYIPALVFSGLSGYRLSGWYEVFGNETNTLEVVIAPFVIISSIVGSGLCWAFLPELFADSTVLPFWPKVFLGGLASFTFLHHTWSILLFGGVSASLLIYAQAKFLTNR